MSFYKVFNFREWRVRIAERHAQAGRLGAAEGAFHRILARQPTQGSALAGLGRLLLRNRRFEEAIEIWQRAVKIYPGRSDPAFQLARALHRSGRLEAAAAQYLLVLELDPLHEKAFVAVEQLSARLGRSGGAGIAAMEAATALAQQLVQHSDSERIRNSALGLLASLQAKTDPDAAARYWEQLATLNPQSMQPLLAIARIRKRQHNSDEARRFFRAILDSEPEHAEALVGYGQALAEADHAAAIDHFVNWSTRRGGPPRNPCANSGRPQFAPASGSDSVARSRPTGIVSRTLAANCSARFRCPTRPDSTRRPARTRPSTRRSRDRISCRALACASGCGGVDRTGATAGEAGTVERGVHLVRCRA